MKVKVNLEHKRLFLAFGILVILISAVTVYAVAPNPGHDASSIGPGSFSGTTSDAYNFPGDVGVSRDVYVTRNTFNTGKTYAIGQLRVGVNAETPSTNNRDLYVNNPSAYAGVVINSNGPDTTGDTYIDFTRSGVLRANINYDSDGQQLRINDQPTNTVLNGLGGGKVGIGGDPNPLVTLQVSSPIDEGLRLQKTGASSTNYLTFQSGSFQSFIGLNSAGWLVLGPISLFSAAGKGIAINPVTGNVDPGSLPIGSWCGWSQSNLAPSNDISCGGLSPRSACPSPSIFAPRTFPGNGGSTVTVCIRYA